MNNILASLFRAFFRIPVFRDTFFGVNEKIFRRTGMFRGWRKKFTVRGLMIDADMSDWIPQNLYFYNEYEEKELRFVENTLKPGDTFIDVGANIGLFSLVASRSVGSGGKVIAFEPYKPTYEDLLRNAQLNKATNIIAEQKAIGSTPGVITLYANEKDNNPGMVSANNVNMHNTFTHAQKCEAITLDQYVNENDITSIKIIKIDIEGFEVAALQGMLHVLQVFRPVLLIEILDKLHIGKHNVTMADDILIPLGYKRYYLNNKGIAITQKMEGDSSGNVVFKAD